MLKESASFFINPSSKTPFVEFNLHDGKLDIIGKSAPKASPEFYEQINSWIKECLSAVGNSLNVNISFEDSDISSNDDFFGLLRTLKTEEANKDISVNWYYYGYKDHERKALVTQMNELGISCKMHSYSV